MKIIRSAIAAYRAGFDNPAADRLQPVAVTLVGITVAAWVVAAVLA